MTLDEAGNVLVLGVVYQYILFGLVFGDVHLCQLVVAERGEVVKMLLVHVEQQRNMR